MTIPSYSMLRPGYAKLWAGLVPSPGHVPALTAICRGLIAHKVAYQQVAQHMWGDAGFWWYVAITDQMEGGGGASTFLGNGQSLHEVTTQEPIGEGPFASFYDGAIAALRGVPAPKSVEQAAYNWEGFNGWGYLSKKIEDPYLAAQSNEYSAGKYVADHDYDPSAISQQPGALTILKVLLGIDSTIQIPVDTVPLPQPPPLTSSTPQPQKETPPMTTTVTTAAAPSMPNFSSMAATAEKVVEEVAKIEPTIATVSAMFVPGAAPVVAMVQPAVLLAIPYVERALNDIASSNGGDLMNALIELLQHVTSGQPNSAVLAPAKAA